MPLREFFNYFMMHSNNNFTHITALKTPSFDTMFVIEYVNTTESHIPNPASSAFGLTVKERRTGPWSYYLANSNETAMTCLFN